MVTRLLSMVPARGHRPGTQMMPDSLSSAFLGPVPGRRRWLVPGRAALSDDPAGGRFLPQDAA